MSTADLAWLVFGVNAGCALLGSLVAQFVLIPWLERRLDRRSERVAA